MNKDFERLTDDIIEFICEHGIAVVKFREEVEPEEFAGIDAYVGFGREHAKQLISLVAKGPLPGEVGRAKGYADTKGYDSGFRGQADVELIIDEHNVPKRGIYDGDRLEFIALSPTSHREGQEEEEDVPPLA